MITFLPIKVEKFSLEKVAGNIIIMFQKKDKIVKRIYEASRPVLKMCLFKLHHWFHFLSKII